MSNKRKVKEGARFDKFKSYFSVDDPNAGRSVAEIKRIREFEKRLSTRFLTMINAALRSGYTFGNPQASAPAASSEPMPPTASAASAEPATKPVPPGPSSPSGIKDPRLAAKQADAIAKARGELGEPDWRRAPESPAPADASRKMPPRRRPPGRKPIAENNYSHLNMILESIIALKEDAAPTPDISSYIARNIVDAYFGTDSDPMVLKNAYALADDMSKKYMPVKLRIRHFKV